MPNVRLTYLRLHNVTLCLLQALLVFIVTACSDDVTMPDGRDYSYVRKYYVKHLYERSQQLYEISEGRGADFLYITDTHLTDNDLESPAMLRFLLAHGLADKVIWGGDAITAFGDIEEQWKRHQQLFADALQPLGRYYMVRGNHEFTAMSPDEQGGQTYGPLRTAQLLCHDVPSDVVRPTDDPTACYYYFDDTQRRLRFCVFDTTDSITSLSQPWSTVERISDQQLDWMDAHALHNVPAGYGLIIVTHIGIIEPTYRVPGPFSELHQRLLEADAPVLMVVSGHMHQDFQTYDHGTLHLLTGSDATYKEFGYSPFLHQEKRRRHSESAQLFDCFTISPDHRMIDAIRIGAGYNRTFHLDTLQVSLVSRRKLSTTRLLPSDVVAWSCYDAQGYACLDDAWQPPSTRIYTTADGTILPLHTGDAVVMATDRKGHKEFFPVTVIP